MFALLTAKPDGRRVTATLVVLLLDAVTATVVSMLDSNTLRATLAPLYGVQTVALFWMAWWTSRGNPYQMMRPSLLFLVYIGLNCALGAALYHSDQLVSIQIVWAADYRSWSNLHETFLLISGSLTAMFLTHSWYDYRIRSIPSTVDYPMPAQLNVALLLILLIFSTGIIASFFSDHAVVIVIISVCATAYLLMKYRHHGRWVILISLVAVTGITSFESKRNAVFLLLPIALLALLSTRQLRLSIPNVIVGGVATAALIIAVGTMSVLRGYGGYGVETIAEALAVVPQYLTGGQALAMLGNNFEFSYMFFTIHHSVSSVLSGDVDPMNGETYLRALFVGIPLEVFSYRPESILDSYTSFLDPVFRLKGGSWPCTALGEAFWNFGAFGILVIPLLSALMDALYRVIVARFLSRSLVFATIGLSLYTFLLFFIRGAGLNMFLAYAVLAIGLTFVFFTPFSLLNLQAARRDAPRMASDESAYPARLRQRRSR